MDFFRTVVYSSLRCSSGALVDVLPSNVYPCVPRRTVSRDKFIVLES
jgi:hypothetical protein